MSTVGSTIPLPPPSDTILPLVTGTTTTLWFIALVTYVLRIYTRCRPYPNLGWDDFAISWAMVLTTVNWAVNLGIQSATGGRHIQYLTRRQMEAAGELGFIAMVIWIWAITALKVSVALMLLRIKQSPRWKYGIWSLIIVLNLVGVGTTCAQILQCVPVRANWDIMLRMSGRDCWTEEKQEIVTYSVSALFAATDVVCALLPLFFIVKINRPMREKISLFLVMSMGLLACACGLVKTALVKGILHSTDPVWEGASIAIWTYSEEYLGIIAANIPCLKSLLEAAFRQLGGHITNITKSASKCSTRDLDSFPAQSHDLSTLTPLKKAYKNFPTGTEDDPVGYHASLRETSRLKKMERCSESQEEILLELKGIRQSVGLGFDFDFVGDMRGDCVTREVHINGKRVDQYDPR